MIRRTQRPDDSIDWFDPESFRQSIVRFPSWLIFETYINITEISIKTNWSSGVVFICRHICVTLCVCSVMGCF